jgi:hypothetical protein
MPRPRAEGLGQTEAHANLLVIVQNSVMERRNHHAAVGLAASPMNKL